MNLAIEYLVRSGVIQSAARPPISLFLSEKESRLVVTIKDEFSPSDHYTVNHWDISSCQSHQVLPSISEFRVAKDKLFTHHATVLPGYNLLAYQHECIPTDQNTYYAPMMHEIYSYYFDNFLDSLTHRDNKINWLWLGFVKIYIPEIWEIQPYISQAKSVSELAEKQRTFVMRKYPKVWGFWKKWNKYLLFPEYVSGELLFANEYS